MAVRRSSGVHARDIRLHGSGSAVHRKETLQRVRDTSAFARPPSPDRQRKMPAFPVKCCFSVIYFVSNIFSLWLRRIREAARAETSRLTRVTENMSAKL
jgi:hypothetical protein